MSKNSSKSTKKSAKSADKTNVMRILDQKHIPYKLHSYDNMSKSAAEVAAALNIAPDALFKTLVTVGKSGAHYVFMVPGSEELDLKKAAIAAGEKSVAMIPQRELLPLTGYVHGGCSPVGMKKQFPAFIDSSAENHREICFSAGKIGKQVQLSPADLKKAVPISYAMITSKI